MSVSPLLVRPVPFREHHRRYRVASRMAFPVRNFVLVFKSSCFAEENNLICLSKQLVFLNKITYFATQNNLF